eukprot:2587357-Prymnesium_polylepis.2
MSSRARAAAQPYGQPRRGIGRGRRAHAGRRELSRGGSVSSRAISQRETASDCGQADFAWIWMFVIRMVCGLWCVVALFIARGLAIARAAALSAAAGRVTRSVVVRSPP